VLVVAVEIDSETIVAVSATDIGNGAGAIDSSLSGAVVLTMDVARALLFFFCSLLFFCFFFSFFLFCFFFASLCFFGFFSLSFFLFCCCSCVFLLCCLCCLVNISMAAVFPNNLAT